MRTINQVAVAFVASFALVFSSADSAPIAIASSVSTAMTVNAIHGRLNEVIERARQVGDYMTMRAGFQIKDSLDAWKRVNGDLLTVAFDRLDESQRNAFASIVASLNAADVTASNRLAQAQSLSDSAQQLVNSIPFNKAVVVTRSEPRVVRPDGTQRITYRVFGTNLDNGLPEIVVGRGRPNIKPISVTPTEAVFEFDRKLLAFSPSYIVNNVIPISYKPIKGIKLGFGARNAGTGRILQRLNVATLPSNVGYLTWNSRIATQNRIQQGALCDLGDFRGRNENIRKGVAANCNSPSDPDWRVDYTSAIAVLQGDGEAARCEGWEGASPNGFRV